jgi:hypothetical protein
MKRIVVAIIIPVFSITLGIFSFFFVKNTCNQVVSGLDEVLHNVLTEDVEEVNRLTVQTNRNWHKKVFLLNILIGRTNTNEVDKLLNKIVYFSEIGDYDAVLLNAEDCKEELLYIIESNEPELSAVF